MNFNNLVIGILWEQNVSGGAGSAFGAGVAKTASSQSGDNLEPNDSRAIAIKPLYSGMLSRFGMKSTKSTKKSKNRKRKQKR